MPTGPYRYSFSGADAKAFVYFDGGEDYISPLESLHTISVSVHEAKGQARALGHRGIKGISRGIRTIAGSLILTVIEDHPLRVLMENYQHFDVGGSGYPGWSLDYDQTGVGTALNQFDFKSRIASTLPPFNLLLEYVSENAQNNLQEKLVSEEYGVPRVDAPGETTYYGTRARIPGAGLLLRDIEIVDAGIVTSVNDIVSEMVFSFIACDIKPLSQIIYSADGPQIDQDKNYSDNARLHCAMFGTCHYGPGSDTGSA